MRNKTLENCVVILQIPSRIDLLLSPFRVINVPTENKHTLKGAEKMKTRTASGLKITYFGTIPANLEELVNRLESFDNREVGRKARQQEDKGDFTCGIIQAVKKALQGRNKANQTVTDPKAAREDRLLRTRDSSGKATARKF